MNLLQQALDADLYSREKRIKGLIPTRGTLTLLDASILAGVIKYKFTLLAWTKDFKPIVDLEFDTKEEAKRIAKAIKRKGYHGLIQHIVRKKAESGFMGYHATLSKDWTF